MLAIVFCVVYTGFSEWVSVRWTWNSAEWMPVIPLDTTRIGVSPLAQWFPIALV